MGIAEAATGGSSVGVRILVAGGIMLEAVAACCSSPQTAEINADKRAETLMKWVHMGLTLGLILVAIAAVCDRKHAGSYLVGGGVTGGAMYLMYGHARSAGLASSAPGTEG